MLPRARRRFDALLDEIIASLPPRVQSLLEETPVLVDDRPSRRLLTELGLSPGDVSLCGLHSGTPLIERSVTHGPDLPETIHLFREGIIELAGGWQPWEDEEQRRWGGEEEVRRQIRITLLHEIGHHFGLDEADLAALGYE
jgi:predicted Zn-dependent protease with MMP-like domain